ncbi:hypothetical protein BRARA_A01198 [Brassica rapa]|uniref:Major facilitator superfamily (MFS) profile domain-containing protein n=1 Tax=Brassica campestris TaxID=3711 RepID=A0A398AMY4_BRACM|nr:hypothetical protein BRARA_A01198 [Brassica rapa]
MDQKVRQFEVCTQDGSVDRHGNPAIRAKTGKWLSAILILVNQGLATLAFFGVGVNLVLFLTRVMGQDNAEAANSVSKWTGTVYIFSLLGAFLSDSYWGRYKTCAIFQGSFVVGLVMLSFSTAALLLEPSGCGVEESPCKPHSTFKTVIFYLSVYLIALGYFEDQGDWPLGFWASTGSAFAGLVLFLTGTPKYRHFTPRESPWSRFCQVLVAATRKAKIDANYEDMNLYDSETQRTGDKKILHTSGFRFLDRAAIVTPDDDAEKVESGSTYNPWRLCSVTQVEEVKCVFRLIPIWLCTILYSVVFTQMASLFVEQGAAMKTNIKDFKIPASSMSSFDILSVAFFIFAYRRFLDPLFARLNKTEPNKGLTELQRMGIGLVIAVMAMISAGIVEIYRLKHKGTASNSSSLSIFWQVPQYMMIGASEVFMYVGQLEFFNSQAPTGLKSFASALCMASISLGNYVSSLLVSIVMSISTRDDLPGWIPGNLNKGHLDRFYFLLAGLTAADFVVYLVCAKWYKYIKSEASFSESTSEEEV